MFSENRHLKILAMKKTKKQLAEMGFLFVTLSGGAKRIVKYGKSLDDVEFKSTALTDATLIRRANAYLEAKES